MEEAGVRQARRVLISYARRDASEIAHRCAMR